MFIKRHVLVTCQKRWDYIACLVICNHMWLKHYRATRGHKKWFCHQTAAEARITKAVGSKCTLIRVVLISMLWFFSARDLGVDASCSQAAMFDFVLASRRDDLGIGAHKV